MLVEVSVQFPRLSFGSRRFSNLRRVRLGFLVSYKYPVLSYSNLLLSSCLSDLMKNTFLVGFKMVFDCTGIMGDAFVKLIN